MEADLAYYRRRAAEERSAAEAASDPFVRAVHLDLARRYGEQILAIEQHPETRPELRLVASV